MIPFHGWSVAVRETPIKSSVTATAGNSVGFILIPMSCAQAHSQAIVKKFTLATLSAQLAISLNLFLVLN